MATSYRMGDGSSISASLEGSVGRRFSFAPAWVASDLRLRGTLGVALRLWHGMRASLTLGATTRPGELQVMYGLLDAGVNLDLLSGHRLHARVRAISPDLATTYPEPAVVISYSLPLAVPMSGSDRAGRLIGRVYDAETGDGLERALISVAGRSAMTDGHGRFEIGGLAPGSHPLRVDPPAGGPDLVPLEGSPTVTVPEGGRRGVRMDIALARPGRVSGAIHQLGVHEDARPDDPEPELVEIGGLAGVVVELTRGSQAHRRIADSRGRFDFSRLSPGTWTLRVVSEAPARHHMEPETMEIEVGPGAIEDVRIDVVPEVRPVRIL